MATAGDVNGDGYADVIVGAWLFDNGESDEGRAFVFLGSAAGLGSSPAWTAESDQASANFGISVATAGDVNGDGYSDIIAGAQLYDNGQLNEGRVFVYLGSPSGPVTTPSWGSVSNQLQESLGWSTASAGDVNGDGFSDVVVGAPEYDNGHTDEGRALLYLGSASGLTTTPAWTFEGDQDGICFGISVASAGDVNGDGYADVIVGASGRHPGGGVSATTGRAFVFLGSASGLAPTPAWMVTSDQDLDALGHSVASAGDVNGDGYSDVIVGAYLYDNPEIAEGRAYVYLGSPSGLANSPAWTAESDQASATFGFAVATAGDVNADGYSDVLVGAQKYDDSTSIRGGRVYLFLGSASGLSTLPAWTDGHPTLLSTFGYAVGTAGDVNGDGYSDFIVGAPFWPGGLANGQAVLYLGASSGSPVGTWSIIGATGDFLGVAVGTAGDTNNDGYGDVLVSSVSFSALQIFYGSSAGPAATAGWTAGYFTVPDSCELGDSLATAGDVNGDGYPDIIAGDSCGGLAGGGSAHVFYGSEGGGVLRHLRQARTDDTAPIAYLGKSDSETDFLLKERGVTPAGRGRVRLQFEVEPLGTLFDGTGLGATPLTDTGTPGGSGSAVDLSELAGGLTENSFYHWRARIVSSDPFFPRSPWMTLEGKSMTETKLRSGGCIDGDGDGYGTLGDPSCLSLTPDCSDSDATAWDTPGAVLNLRFTSATTLAWEPPANPGALSSSIVYDTLGSTDPDDFLSLSTLCVESDDGWDTEATITAIPPLGQMYIYLTRAENACPSGSGPLGFDSQGNPRTGRVCP